MITSQIITHHTALLTIQKIFTGYREHRTPSSSGALLICAQICEGSIQEGDLVEMIGVHCRVRSQVRWIKIQYQDERVSHAHSGETIILMLEGVFFTEVEVGDQIYVSSETLKLHQESHSHWSSEELLDYETMIQMGHSLRELLKSPDLEILEQAHSLLLAIELDMNLAKRTALREVLGGLILRNPKYHFVFAFYRFIRAPKDTKSNQLLIREIKQSLMRLISSSINHELISETPHYYSYLNLSYGDTDHDRIGLANCRENKHLDIMVDQVIPQGQLSDVIFSRYLGEEKKIFKRLKEKSINFQTIKYRKVPHDEPLGRLKFEHHLCLSLISELVETPQLLEYALADLKSCTHLKVSKMQGNSDLETHCQEFIELLKCLPQLTKLTLHRHVNHEMWLVLQSYPELTKLFDYDEFPDEQYAQEISYAEKLRALLDNNPEQMVSLALMMTDYQRGMLHVFKDLVEDKTPLTLIPTEALINSLPKNTPQDQISLVYAAILKITGLWQTIPSSKLTTFNRLLN